MAFANNQLHMARPLKQRCVNCAPVSDYFKPRGVPMSALAEVALELDELEALRLADLDGLYQADVALQMGVSRQTVGNILTRAHRKIADALLNGKALRIAGQAGEGMESGFRVRAGELVSSSVDALSLKQDSKELS